MSSRASRVENVCFDRTIFPVVAGDPPPRLALLRAHVAGRLETSETRRLSRTGYGLCTCVITRRRRKSPVMTCQEVSCRVVSSPPPPPPLLLLLSFRIDELVTGIKRPQTGGDGDVSIFPSKNHPSPLPTHPLTRARPNAGKGCVPVEWLNTTIVRPADFGAGRAPHVIINNRPGVIIANRDSRYE